jgi:hypothetical protein
VGGVQPVQDGKHRFRCRGGEAPGVRSNRGERAEPGRITDTHLSRYLGDTATGPAGFEPNSTAVSWKTVQQGAATSVLLVASPLLDGVSGCYFEARNEAELHQPGIRRGVAASALDPGNTARLWQLSVETLASEGSRTSS